MVCDLSKNALNHFRDLTMILARAGKAEVVRCRTSARSGGCHVASDPRFDDIEPLVLSSSGLPNCKPSTLQLFSYVLTDARGSTGMQCFGFQPDTSTVRSLRTLSLQPSDAPSIS